MTDFQTFCVAAHQKRVDHFTDYCQTENRKPILADAIEIFGFCERDAQPIVTDTITALRDATEWD